MINISKNEFAKALVSEELTEANRLLLVLDIAAEEGELLNSEAEGRDVSRQWIGLGLKRKALGELPPDLKPSVSEWLSEPREFHTKAGGGEPARAREILFVFWVDDPGQGTSDEPLAIRHLNTIARAAGFEDVHRMIGGSLCHGDGSRSITLELKP